MALQKGVNSYATVEEANAFFADRLDVAAWTAADDTQKAQSLVTATALLDDRFWVGSAVSGDQDLAFPRIGSYLDPRLGTVVTLDGTTVPDRIIKACYELAYHLLNNDGLLDDTGGVDNLQIGPIQLNRVKKPDTIPDVVSRLIRPLLKNNTNSWWRAN